jgi:CubicO group peptidase (beta-lactamase class C family)
LASVQVLEGFDAAGVPRTRPPKRPITLLHLLTHTAGYGYPVWSEALVRYYEVMGLPSTGSCENAALRAPLLFDPGEGWSYGINLEWTGKVIEAVSGQRLGIYLQENLLGPLGMTDTAFKITPSMRQRLARVHQRGGDGTLQPIEFEVPQEPESEMGGGGLYSTATDYSKFLRMFLNRGRCGSGQVLKPETIDLMSRNHLGELRVTKLKTAMPARSNDVELFPGIPKSWGLTFMINEERAPTGRSPGGLAWGGLANSYYWIDPAKKVGGVYLTQILPFGDHKALPLFLEFESAVYQSC